MLELLKIILKKVKKIGEYAVNLWRKNEIFSALIVLIATFLLLGIIYFQIPGASTTGDQFFHFKLAKLLRTEGWSVISDFDYVYYSKYLKDWDRYDLSLFQVSIIPFTYISDPILGMKIMSVFFAALTMALIYYVFRKIGMKYPLFFSMLLIVSSGFVYRIMTGRGFVFIVALVALEMYLAIEKKHKKLFFVILFHILWHYTSFALPFIVIGIVEASRYLIERKFFYKNWIVPFAALILGYAFFPGFPKNLINITKEFFFLIFKNSKLGFGKVENAAFFELIQGRELSVIDINTFFTATNHVFIIASFIIGAGIGLYCYVELIKNRKKILNDKKGSLTRISVIATFIASSLFLWGTLIISGRLFDFYMVFSVMLLGTSFTYLINFEKIKLDKSIGMVLSISLIVFFVAFGTFNYLKLLKIYNSYDYKQVQEAAAWVGSKSEEGEIIYLSNWVYFGIMFFENSKNVYTMGMEPNLLKDYDEELFWKWYNVKVNNYYCEEQKDCSEEKNQFFQALEKMTEKEKEDQKKKNGRKIIEMVKDDFNSRFFISDNEDVSEYIELNNDLVLDRFESKSEIIPRKMIVHQFK